jgi:hypothetical protein
MPLTDDQRLSIENTFEALLRSSHPATDDLRTELAERRWTGDARVVDSFGVKTTSVHKDRDRATVLARLEYTVIRDSSEGGGRAGDLAEATFVVYVDDIDADKPRATGFRLKDVRDPRT